VKIKKFTIRIANLLVRLDVLTLAELKIKIFSGCEIRFSGEFPKFRRHRGLSKRQKRLV
jgi:hypothetical protein